MDMRVDEVHVHDSDFGAHRFRRKKSGRPVLKGIPGTAPGPGSQNPLKGATVSKGGHRRVSRAVVLEWKEQHQASGKGADLRTKGQKISAYKSPEAEVVRRVKALAKRS